MRRSDSTPGATDDRLKLVLARSLEQARPGSFMYVDHHGRVRSPGRYRAMQTVGYGAIVSVPVVYGLLFGPVGAALGLAVSGFLGLRTRNALRVQRAALLIAHGRLGEATALLEKIVKTRLLARENRVAAYCNLASCASLRGDHAAALAWIRKARALAGTLGKRAVHRPLAAYQEISILIELGRTEEARAALDALGEARPGEYMRVNHWVAELYVCMAEGRCALDDDDLHERARKALAITTSSKLLALTAWAFAERGNHDMAAHTISEAFDRLEEERLERMMPRLYTWMCSYRAQHLAGAEQDPDAHAEDL